MVSRESRTLSFTSEQAEFLDRCVASGRYQSVSEVVRESLRLLEQAEQRRLLEKWLYEGLTADEQSQLDPALLDRARRHFQRLIDEGLHSAEEQGWIDGEQVMKHLRQRVQSRVKKPA